MAGEADGLTSFLFYTLFVYPSCSWILKPGRFPKKRAVLYAVAFLAGLAFLKTGAEVMERGGNHYTKLGVYRTSTAMEIKKVRGRTELKSSGPDVGPNDDGCSRALERLSSRRAPSR